MMIGLEGQGVGEPFDKGLKNRLEAQGGVMTHRSPEKRAIYYPDCREWVMCDPT